MADTFEAAINSLSSSDSLTRQHLVIDNDLRTIKTPTKFILGVFNDKDVHEVLFTMPRFYNEVDLADFSIRVNYINAAGNENNYFVETETIGDEVIEFSWVTSRGVFEVEGVVQFSVCLRKVNEDDVITQEFNTTTATGRVLKGIEVDNHEDDPEVSDLITKITKAKAAAEEAAKQSEENVEHYPRIEAGKWIVYDAKNDAWVDTGISSQGPKGDTGETGAKGDTGKTPDFHIGVVYNVPYGQSATASITGTAERPILSLAIPEGPKGDKGDKGDYPVKPPTANGTYVLKATKTEDGVTYAWVGE